MDSREWFDSVRAECAGMRTMRARLDSLRSGQRGNMGGGSHAGTSDRVPRAVVAISELEARMGEAAADIDAASACIEGVGRALGERYAAVLHLRYIECMDWERVGRECGYSPDRCKHLRAIAMDYIDSVGVAGAIEGRPVPST